MNTIGIDLGGTWIKGVLVGAEQALALVEGACDEHAYRLAKR